MWFLLSNPMVNFKAKRFICAFGGKTKCPYQSMDNFPTPAPFKSRFTAGVVPASPSLSALLLFYAILNKRKFHLAVPGAPNSALPCHIKQKLSTSCGSLRSTDLIGELIPGSLEMRKCIAGSIPAREKFKIPSGWELLPVFSWQRSAILYRWWTCFNNS